MFKVSYVTDLTKERADQLEKIKSNSSKLRSYVRKVDYASHIIEPSYEDKWNVDDSIVEAIIKTIPEDYSPEDKAMYIYGMMCKSFKFDEGYNYKDYLNKPQYNMTFSKKHLEAIKYGDKITCYDFGRIFANLVTNYLPDDPIQGYIITKGDNLGHVDAGFVTDNVVYLLDGIDIISNSMSDLTRAKQNIHFGGVTKVHDLEDLVAHSLFEKIYPNLNGEKDMSMQSYLEALHSINASHIEESNEVDLSKKLEAFINSMKAKGITGTEFLQSFVSLYKNGFFESNIERGYYGKENQKSNGEAFYERYVILRETKDYEQNGENATLYVIDPNRLMMRAVNQKEFLADEENKLFVSEGQWFNLNDLPIGNESRPQDRTPFNN